MGSSSMARKHDAATNLGSRVCYREFRSSPENMMELATR